MGVGFACRGCDKVFAGSRQEKVEACVSDHEEETGHEMYQLDLNEEGW